MGSIKLGWSKQGDKYYAATAFASYRLFKVVEAAGTAFRFENWFADVWHHQSAGWEPISDRQTSRNLSIENLADGKKKVEEFANFLEDLIARKKQETEDRLKGGSSNG